MRPHLKRSLSAHLRETEDHSRLPFHPSCPVCRRDRLAGSLDGEELVSRRTQAAIAAGLLAFSTGGAPAAVAAPPDEVTEGTSEVLPGGDWSSHVDFEPGGETPQLPDEVTPLPTVPAPVTDSEDAGPLEQEPASDVRAPVGDEAPAPAAEPETVASEPTAPPMTTPTTPASDADPAESQSQQRAVDPGPIAEGGHRREARRSIRDEAVQPTAPVKRPTTPAVNVTGPTTPMASATTATTTASVDTEPATTRLVNTATDGAAKGDRFHVVQHGESLWSIAADRLGDGATVGRVAREVHRLWELNEERIGTGQPDLLYAGTRLRLR